MRTVELTRGYLALVDDEDYERVSEHKWHSSVYVRFDGSTSVYAVRNVRLPSGEKRPQYMHRFIVGEQPGMCTDHIDGDGLNNTKENLRFCTTAENARNSRRHGGSSKWKGVSWHKGTGKWQAQIRVCGQNTHIGLFSNEIEAARAYDNAAVIAFGEFARTNM